MTPQPWYDHASHTLHRERRRPCGQCPWPATDTVDEHDELLPRQAYCQAERANGGTLCQFPSGHLGGHYFGPDRPPRQHDQDCIELCDGVACDRWHSCWCAADPQDYVTVI